MAATEGKPSEETKEETGPPPQEQPQVAALPEASAPKEEEVQAKPSSILTSLIRERKAASPVQEKEADTLASAASVVGGQA